MKSFFIALYFTAMLFIVAFLIADFGYAYPDALFVSSTYLPTIVLAHALTRNIKFRGGVQIFGALLATFGIFILQLLLITLANYAMHRLSYEITMPKIVINPILVFMIFMLYYLPYRLIILRLFKESRAEHEERRMEFVSNRKRINLYVRDILYVESCDTEVWIHTLAGESHRSRTNISSWQRELGDDFLRIHRSYLINLNSLQSIENSTVRLSTGLQLEVSRSYRGAVEEYKSREA